MKDSQILSEAINAMREMSQDEFIEFWTQNFGRGKPLAERMKEYEKRDAHQYKNYEIVIARIDGRGFSKLTKNLNKPFDDKFTDRMIEVTKALVKETGATIGYTQSDEISLVWHTDNPNGQIFFNGKVQKLCSICASIATAAFNAQPPISATGLFDCRVFVVPNKSEAINYLIYRQRDCIKNSVGMVASETFSHKVQMHKTTTDKLEMLMSENINWTNDYRCANRLGTFVQRQSCDVSTGSGPLDFATRTFVGALILTEQLSFNVLYKVVFG